MATTKKGAVPKAQGIRYRTRADGTVRGYEVRYRDPKDNNRVRGKSFRTLEEAKAWQRDNLHSIQHGTYIAPEKGGTTWAVVSQEWLSGRVKLRARTRQGYDGILSRWLNTWDTRPINSVNRSDVRKLLQAIRDAGLAEESEHKIVTVASMVFKYAIKEGYIRSNPASEVRDELRSLTMKDFAAHPLTRSEVESIIAKLPEGRMRLFAVLGLWSGMRAGELAGLRVRNVDRLRNVVQVDETVEDLGGHLRPGIPKTKRSRGRRIPIPKAVMEQLGDYIDTEGLKPDAYLFVKGTEFFHYQNWRNRHWIPACRAAGFVEPVEVTRGGKTTTVLKSTVRFHDVRHAYASMQAAAGVQPHVLKQRMGHSTITTTMNIYTHVHEGDPTMEALIEKLYADYDPAASTVVELPAVKEGLTTSFG